MTTDNVASADEPTKKREVLALLATWEPLNEEFPEIGDLPLDDVNL